MLSVLISLVAVVVTLYWLYKVTTSNHDYFKNMGLKNLKPYPIFGTTYYMLFRRKPLHDQLMEFYCKFPGEKIFGTFEFASPTFFINDIELLKHLTIKDFAYFQDHKPMVEPKYDTFFGNTLFAMQGKAWRDMRSTLSPLFTGSKMKMMFQLIHHCTNQFVDYLQEECQKTGKVNFKSKELFSKFTNDVIASCAFGLECNSLKNTDNEFLEIGNEFSSIQKPWKLFQLILIRCFPKLTYDLGFTMFSKKIRGMFNRLIIDAMKIRRIRGIKRPDMIQLLMNLKDGNCEGLYEKDNKKLENERNEIKGELKKSWTDDEIIAQSFIFFLAGFDTSSNLLQFLFYELGLHQDIQQRLYEEIVETSEILKGEPLNYEVMKGMKYTKMVINEVLRKWPPIVAVDRLCVKDYSYQDENGLKFTVKEGNNFLVAIYSFHMDPKYFPNPEVFDPERFSDENIGNNNMDAFIPFGIGPRSCIGFRFALMEIKSLVYYLLLNFKVNIGKDMDVPLKFTTSFFGWSPKREIQIELEPRNVKKDL